MLELLLALAIGWAIGLFTAVVTLTRVLRELAKLAVPEVQKTIETVVHGAEKREPEGEVIVYNKAASLIKSHEGDLPLAAVLEDA